MSKPKGKATYNIGNKECAILEKGSSRVLKAMHPTPAGAKLIYFFH